MTIFKNYIEHNGWFDKDSSEFEDNESEQFEDNESEQDEVSFKRIEQDEVLTLENPFQQAEVPFKRIEQKLIKTNFFNRYKVSISISLVLCILFYYLVDNNYINLTDFQNYINITELKNKVIKSFFRKNERKSIE